MPRSVLNMLLILTFVSLRCAKDDNNPPTCRIITPSDSDIFSYNDDLIITTEAEDNDEYLEKVNYYLDGKFIVSKYIPPFSYDLNLASFEEGEHVIKATAYDDKGKRTSDEIIIYFNDTRQVFVDKRDENEYRYISANNQKWMAENLNYEVVNGSWVYNNDSSNSNVYGRLYDWETACNVCPDGWRLPEMHEYEDLVEYLGGKEVAGGKLKESTTIHWYEPNEGAANEIGFTALPGGFYLSDQFGSRRFKCYFWTSTLYKSSPQYIELNYKFQDVRFFTEYERRRVGLSVRCVSD